MNNIDNEIILCYSGSLDRNHWNDPELYAKFIYKYVNSIDIQTLFLFLIPEYSRGTLIKTLKQHRVDLKLCLIESPKYTEIPKYLSVGDIGMYFLLHHSPRVGTKFVEYCSIGLPVLVNENVEGATNLVNKFKLGIFINNKISVKSNKLNSRDIKMIRYLIQEREKYQKRCRDFAVNNFDNKIIINEYESIYNYLLIR